jgi:hypothetical protein
LGLLLLLRQKQRLKIFEITCKRTYEYHCQYNSPIQFCSH